MSVRKRSQKKEEKKLVLQQMEIFLVGLDLEAFKDISMNENLLRKNNSSC